MARQQVFIALQCFDCETMQVKQQTKSSNKWICAVCNQKQSVKKVFARSSLAKDVRGFVQRFNMTRSSAEHEKSVYTLSDHQNNGRDRSFDLEEEECDPVPRTDWSQYLDPIEGEDLANDDSRADVLFVTEMPTRKSNKRTITSKTLESHRLPREDEHSRTSQWKPHSSGSAATKYSVSVSGTVEKRRCLSVKSKWSKYVDEDDICEEIENGGTSPKQRVSLNDAVNFDLLGSVFDEEVHPDFL